MCTCYAIICGPLNQWRDITGKISGHSDISFLKDSETSTLAHAFYSTFAIFLKFFSAGQILNELKCPLKISHKTSEIFTKPVLMKNEISVVPETAHNGSWYQIWTPGYSWLHPTIIVHNGSWYLNISYILILSEMKSSIFFCLKRAFCFVLLGTAELGTAGVALLLKARHLSHVEVAVTFSYIWVNLGDECGNNEVYNYYTGWWFEPLWKTLVNWDDYSQYMGK